MLAALSGLAATVYPVPAESVAVMLPFTVPVYSDKLNDTVAAVLPPVNTAVPADSVLYCAPTAGLYVKSKPTFTGPVAACDSVTRHCAAAIPGAAVLSTASIDAVGVCPCANPRRRPRLFPAPPVLVLRPYTC